MQTLAEGDQQLLTVRQVQQVLNVDRSTIYRMAADGRLPAIRVGKQLRFNAGRIAALLADDAVPSADPPRPPGTSNGPDPAAAQAAAELAADMLGVMVVVTDMDGTPLTPVANPCPWFTERVGDGQTLAACLEEWHALAGGDDLAPRFALGSLGFECARAFVRQGSSLIGMVVAGGVAPLGCDEHPSGLHELDAADREAVLRTLPHVAAAVATASRTSRPPAAQHRGES